MLGVTLKDTLIPPARRSYFGPYSANVIMLYAFSDPMAWGPHGRRHRGQEGELAINWKMKKGKRNSKKKKEENKETTDYKSSEYTLH